MFITLTISKFSKVYSIVAKKKLTLQIQSRSPPLKFHMYEKVTFASFKLGLFSTVDAMGQIGTILILLLLVTVGNTSEPTNAEIVKMIFDGQDRVYRINKVIKLIFQRKLFTSGFHSPGHPGSSERFK